ncbi:MAG: zinc ribbon domain-containing protein [Deltaproteobacteria bacterium]|jgi:putative FmdB family regulatory protein|nr:zinc ribbon domain-containing protein [Deltaproteobacteria bacterium]
MPLYEYECHGCGQVTEALQKFADAPLTVCPKCGGRLTKLMSLNSFALKGSGWYATDYANKSGPPKTDGDKAPKDGAPKDGAAKVENSPSPAKK